MELTEKDFVAILSGLMGRIGWKGYDKDDGFNKATDYLGLNTDDYHDTLVKIKSMMETKGLESSKYLKKELKRF